MTDSASSHFRFIMMAILIICSWFSLAQAQIGPFGSKPIQLGFDKESGIVRKDGGYRCDLDSIGAHYSEWGETEKDARIIVKKACDKQSGILICKEDKITCKQADK